jgi:methionyl-tRNA formyltransferase
VAGTILAGDEVTGVTLMLLDAGMDTGPILAQTTLPVDVSDTTGSLTAKLADLGADLLTMSLPHWFEGRITPVAQNEAEATLTRPLTVEERPLDWHQPAHILERRVRALQPWPEAATTWEGRLLKVLQVVVLPSMEAEPGRVVTPEPQEAPVGVVTGDGVLGLRRVQLEGRRVMGIEEFLRGARGFVGSVLPS